MESNWLCDTWTCWFKVSSMLPWWIFNSFSCWARWLKSHAKVVRQPPTIRGPPELELAEGLEVWVGWYVPCAHSLELPVCHDEVVGWRRQLAPMLCLVHPWGPSMPVPSVVRWNPSVVVGFVPMAVELLLVWLAARHPTRKFRTSAPTSFLLWSKREC